MHLELNQVNLHLVHTLLIIIGNHCRKKKNLSTLSCVRSWVNTQRIIKYFPSPSLPSFSPFLSSLSLPFSFLLISKQLQQSKTHSRRFFGSCTVSLYGKKSVWEETCSIGLGNLLQITSALEASIFNFLTCEEEIKILHFMGLMVK